jgi:glycosyltransferase involved in cell wall biosynthesis
VHVGLDARALVSDVKSGVEYYVTNLVLALSRLDDAPQIIAYVDRPIEDPEIAEAASSGPVTTRVIRSRRGWLRAALPWRLWRDKVNLVHFPSTIMPPILPCPAVVTVHDLAWMHYPETYAKDDLAMQGLAILSALRAAHIITVSESTARDLRGPLRLPNRRWLATPAHLAEKVTVTPLGVSPRFSPDGPRLGPASFAGAEGLAGGYVLYTGNLQPRKNLLRLLAAYARLCSQERVPPLVLAGALSPHAAELRAAAGKLGIERRVLFPGYIPDRQLPALYRSATVFVYPSLYEGFGLQVLEAMASGVPVVTSGTSAMPEVADDAAILVDPESVGRLAWAISLLLTDTELRATMVRRGLARSRQFTWEETARRTAAVYRLVAERKLRQ